MQQGKGNRHRQKGNLESNYDALLRTLKPIMRDLTFQKDKYVIYYKKNKLCVKLGRYLKEEILEAWVIYFLVL